MRTALNILSNKNIIHFTFLHDNNDIYYYMIIFFFSTSTCLAKYAISFSQNR